MVEFFLRIAEAGFVALVFVLGWTLSADEIAKECSRAGVFHVSTSYFDCQPDTEAKP